MPNGYSRDEALRQIREAAERCGHEPATGDMQGNVGAYTRLFGSWEHAKEEAGVKNYVAPEKEHPPVPTYTYKYHLSPDELAEERRLFLERQAARAGALPTPRPFVLTTHLGRNMKRLRDDEYLPSRDAVDVALSAHR
jgi:hypothetical protein